MTPAEELSEQSKPRSKKIKVVWKCRIRELRSELKLSISRISRSLGISDMGLHFIEHGGNPGLQTAQKICRFFGKPIHEIWPETAKGDAWEK